MTTQTNQTAQIAQVTSTNPESLSQAMMSQGVSTSQDSPSLSEALAGGAPYILAALYKFVRLEDFEEMKPKLLAEMNRLNIKGSLLLATEGINGTVAGEREQLDAFLSYLTSDPRLSDLTHKESYAFKEPFHRAKVNLKREIVTMGVPEVDPRQEVGTYVKPSEWNELIADPDTLLIDTRNDYEYRIGTFEGAVNPETETFREFPQWIEDHREELEKKHKVAMFCTGGIRCEKATSYLKAQGFNEIYHLEGGILKYLEEMKEEESLWRGECFVFDERVSVGHQLVPGEYELCHGCRSPITEAEMQSEYYEPGVCCPHCYDKLTEARKAGFRERHKQILLAEQRNQRHIGQKMPHNTQRHSDAGVTVSAIKETAKTDQETS